MRALGSGKWRLSAHKYKCPDGAGSQITAHPVTATEADGARAERPMLTHAGRRRSGVCPATFAKSALVHRRGLLVGLGALLAAPAIVRAASIMPVKVFDADGAVFTAYPGFARMMMELEELDAKSLATFFLGEVDEAAGTMSIFE